jgi:hypothetical protein
MKMEIDEGLRIVTELAQEIAQFVLDLDDEKKATPEVFIGALGLLLQGAIENGYDQKNWMRVFELITIPIRMRFDIDNPSSGLH